MKVVQLKLRLPEDLRQRLEAEAKETGCSLNRAAVQRLEQSFQQEAAADILTTVRAVLLQAQPAPTIEPCSKYTNGYWILRD